MNDIEPFAALFLFVTWLWVLAVVVLPHRHDRFGRSNWISRIFN